MLRNSNFFGGEIMKTFKVNITETYTRTIEVEAEDQKVTK